MIISGVFVAWVRVIEGRARVLGMFPGRNQYVIIFVFSTLMVAFFSMKSGNWHECRFGL